MGTQISLKLSKKMLTKAKKHAETKGYDSLQDFIREVMRRELFEEPFGGKYTSAASEKALKRTWLTKEEDDAWAHLQKET